MQDHLTNRRIEELIRQLFASPAFDTNRDTSALLYDLPYLKDRIQSIRHAFGSKAFHSLTIKASPVPKLLNHLRNMNVGLEAASVGELKIAEQSGYPPEKIVFDSPVKTYQELEFALEQNVHINADSLRELERIEHIRKRVDSESNIGLRINPHVGTGTIAITSVAGEYSKFGVPLKERREEIIRAYLNYPWLNGIHLHIGSQGCSPEMLVEGVKKVFELVQEIHDEFRKQNINRRIIYFIWVEDYPSPMTAERNPHQ